MMCDECGIRPAQFHLTTISGEEKQSGISAPCAWQNIKSRYRGWILPIWQV